MIDLNAIDLKGAVNMIKGSAVSMGMEVVKLMVTISKNRKEKILKIDFSKSYDAIEAIKILKDNSYVKFDETLDIAIKLGIDSSKN